jgi:hypothetical protein
MQLTIPILKDHGQTSKDIVSAVPAVASASGRFAGAGRCVACRGHPAPGAVGRCQEKLLDLVQAPFFRHRQAAGGGRFLQPPPSGGPARSSQVCKEGQRSPTTRALRCKVERAREVLRRGGWMPDQPTTGGNTAPTRARPERGDGAGRRQFHEDGHPYLLARLHARRRSS